MLRALSVGIGSMALVVAIVVGIRSVELTQISNWWDDFEWPSFFLNQPKDPEVQFVTFRELKEQSQIQYNLFSTALEQISKERSDRKRRIKELEDLIVTHQSALASTVSDLAALSKRFDTLIIEKNHVSENFILSRIKDLEERIQEGGRLSDVDKRILDRAIERQIFETERVKERIVTLESTKASNGTKVDLEPILGRLSSLFSEVESMKTRLRAIQFRLSTLEDGLDADDSNPLGARIAALEALLRGSQRSGYSLTNTVTVEQLRKEVALLTRQNTEREALVDDELSRFNQRISQLFSRPDTPQVLTVREFLIVDAGDRVRMSIGVNEEGEVLQKIFDEGGNVRLEMGLVNEQEDGFSSQLRLRDEVADSSLWLYVDSATSSSHVGGLSIANRKKLLNRSIYFSAYSDSLIDKSIFNKIATFENVVDSKGGRKYYIGQNGDVLFQDELSNRTGSFNEYNLVDETEQ